MSGASLDMSFNNQASQVTASMPLLVFIYLPRRIDPAACLCIGFQLLLSSIAQNPPRFKHLNKFFLRQIREFSHGFEQKGFSCKFRELRDVGADSHNANKPNGMSTKSSLRV